MELRLTRSMRAADFVIAALSAIVSAIVITAFVGLFAESVLSTLWRDVYDERIPVNVMHKAHLLLSSVIGASILVLSLTSYFANREEPRCLNASLSGSLLAGLVGACVMMMCVITQCLSLFTAEVADRLFSLKDKQGFSSELQLWMNGAVFAIWVITLLCLAFTLCYSGVKQILRQRIHNRRILA